MNQRLVHFFCSLKECKVIFIWSLCSCFGRTPTPPGGAHLCWAQSLLSWELVQASSSLQIRDFFLWTNVPVPWEGTLWVWKEETGTMAHQNEVSTKFLLNRHCHLQWPNSEQKQVLQSVLSVQRCTKQAETFNSLFCTCSQILFYLKANISTYTNWCGLLR